MRKAKRKKGNKKLVLLMVLVLLVGIGFAALQSNLRINGNATIESAFSVGIVGIEKSELTGLAYEKNAPTFTPTTATFNVGLMAPGDSITYDITVQNDGNLNAKFDSLVLDQNGASNIKYEVSGVEEGYILAPWVDKVFQVKVTYLDTGNMDEMASKEATVTMLFVQTSENTTEQDTRIQEFENSVSEGLRYSSFVSSSTDNYVTIYGACGDGPGTPGFNTNIYNTGGYLVSEGLCNTPYKIEKAIQTTLKTKDFMTMNGVKYFTEFSEEMSFYFVNSDDGTLMNVADGKNEVVSVLTDFEGTSYSIPNNVKIKVGAFVGSNIDKIILLPSFPLSNLESETLINYKGSTNILKTIVNQTGQSIDWAPIIGAYGRTCEFATGTCGDVTITDVE